MLTFFLRVVSLKPYFEFTKKLLFYSFPAPEKLPDFVIPVFAGLFLLTVIFIFLKIYPPLKGRIISFLSSLFLSGVIFLFLWWENISYLTMPILWLFVVGYLLIKFFLILLQIFALIRKKRQKEGEVIIELVQYF